MHGHSALVLLFLFACLGPVRSQQFPAPKVETRPGFEVATIKPAQEDREKPVGVYIFPGGRLRAYQSTVKMLIEYAFALQEFQIVGGPPWIGEDLYDIEALPPDTSASRLSTPRFVNDPPSLEERAMLQSLLVNRFGLQFHQKTEQGKVWVLARSGRPLRLVEEHRDGAMPVFIVGGYGHGMSGKSVSISFMADRLSRYLQRNIINATGLLKSYNFELPTPPVEATSESNENFISRIFQSVEQLGLILKPGRGEVQMLSIDSISKPTPD